MRARLKNDVRMRTAALIGGTFKMDPIEVMEADYIDWWVRLVAMEIWWDEERKANEKNK